VDIASQVLEAQATSAFKRIDRTWWNSYDILGIIGGDLANSQKASISRMLISISIYLFDAIPLYKYVYSYDNYSIDIHYLGQMIRCLYSTGTNGPKRLSMLVAFEDHQGQSQPWIDGCCHRPHGTQALLYHVVSCCIYIYHVDGIMMVIWCYIHISYIQYIFTIIHSCCLHDHTSRREVDKKWFNMQINRCLRWSCGSALA